MGLRIWLCFERFSSTTPVPLASSTPRKVKRPRTQVPDGKVSRGMNIQKTRAPARRVNQVKNAKEPSMEVTTGSNLPKQRFSLYRADAPSPDPNPPTPFDLLLQHQDMAVPDCLQTSSTRMMSESSTSTTLAVQTPISRVKSSSPVIISDSEEEDDIVQVMPKKFDTKTPISPDVFQKLNAHRIKLSTSRGLLPDQILPRDTLIKLSERRLSDYTEFLRIVEDTSGIPVDNIEERRIYVEEKWTNYGVDFCRICIAFGRKEGILNL
ncbi:hypothetical protein BDP27DRAFT_620177 [Rhodocollybia butyracea]|uniref:Uncharacterized protein n=1 Tax=Rhodocollybia butyracea TaxID=206335 RepID=A0A9P5PW10_9AGAR|nr:hypothetical protein BDP27DRAFT_620177 [Rhodocollybia butyracea]